MASGEVVLKDEKVQAFLKKIDKNTKSFAGAKERYASLIRPIAFKDIISHFQRQQGPSGKWKSWSQSYRDSIAGKVAFRNIGGIVRPMDPSRSGIKPPRKPGLILQDTGRLRGGLRPGKGQKTKGAVVLWINREKTKDGFPYAAHHDKNAKTVRPFMWLSKGALKDITVQTLKGILK